MKKITFYGMAALMLGIGTLSTGCFGEFALVRKVYSWNQSVVSNKFVQTILFYALNFIPVYGIAGAIDLYILNLVEFWTGSNPLAMNEGQVEKQIVKGKDGNNYEITATKNRFDIVQLTGENKGETQSLVFKPEAGVCSVVINNVEHKFLEVNESTNTVAVYRMDGTSVTADLSANINIVKDMFLSSTAYASVK